MGISLTKKIDIVDFIDNNDIIKGASKGEKICRLTLEYLFELKFPTVRHKKIRNPKTNSPLELDCFNPDIKIAIEYQGKQHYAPVKQFHRKNEEKQFIEQTIRDDFKRRKCYKLDIILIEVPYFVPHKRIPKYIIDNIPRSIKISEKRKNTLLESKIYKNVTVYEYLKSMVKTRNNNINKNKKKINMNKGWYDISDKKKVNLQ